MFKKVENGSGYITKKKSLTFNIIDQCKWSLPSFRTETKIFAKAF